LLQRGNSRLRARRIFRLQRRRKRTQRRRNLAPLLPAATAAVMVVMMYGAGPLWLLLKILLDRRVILLRLRQIPGLQILPQLLTFTLNLLKFSLAIAILRALRN
jgi:hypothetical protein